MMASRSFIGVIVLGLLPVTNGHGQQDSRGRVSLPIEVADANRSKLLDGARIRLTPSGDALSGPRAVAELSYKLDYPVKVSVIRTEADNFVGREIPIDPVGLGSGGTAGGLRIHLLPSDTKFNYTTGGRYLSILEGKSRDSVDRALAFFSAAYEEWSEHRTNDAYGYKIWRNYGRSLHNACKLNIADTCELAGEILRALKASLGSFSDDKLQSESRKSRKDIEDMLEKEAQEAEQIPFERVLATVRLLGKGNAAELADAITLAQAVLDSPPEAAIWRRVRTSPELLRRDLADYRVQLALYRGTAVTARTTLLELAIRDYENLRKVRTNASDAEQLAYARNLLQQHQQFR